MKRTAIKRRPKKNPVPVDLRPYIGARDRQCVLFTLDPEHVCRDTFGTRIAPDGQWEMDHIDNAGKGARMHMRWNLVRLCPFAHRLKTENASRYRPMLRAYARRVEAVDDAA